VTASAPPPGRWRRAARRAGLVAALLAAGGAPWWGRAALARVDYFRVRRIEIEGARYVAPDEIVSRLGVDTTWSVWDDTGPLLARVRRHPQVRDARIRRRLPGTLVVTIDENLPVAFVPAAAGLVPVDATGRTLPIDPSRTAVDLPVLAERDTAALRLLGALRGADSALFARVSEVRRDGRDALRFGLGALVVRVRSDAAAARFADLAPVEADLAARGQRALELDLRFRDQVVARLP
jgi:cell division protein FtsQ